MAEADESLLAEMERVDGRTGRGRRQAPVPELPKSTFTAEALRAAYGEKVFVKCVSELKPWTSEKQLDFWKDYEVKPEEAIQLERQRMVVILQPTKK